MTATQKTSLSNKAMLVRLAISQWSVRKYDRKASEKVAKYFNAPVEAGRYTKTLLAEEAYHRVAKVANEVRSFHYQNTLPWYDWGPRLLPAANYLEYTRKIQALKTEFEKAVTEFVHNYPSYVSDAKTRINGLFDPDDYPDPQAIGSYYDFKISVDPLPSKEDFRVNLSSTEVEAIQSDIEARTAEAQAAAMRELWNRLHEAVKAMVERLSDEKAIFRDSLVGNLTDLVGLLPRLNITDDPTLEALRADVEKRLCGYMPSQLREDKKSRRAAAKSARAILDSMSGYMGGAQ